MSVLALFCIVSVVLLAQEPSQQGPPQERTTQEQGQTGQGPKSTLEVKPGKPAITTTEIERKPVGPWKRFPRNVASDEMKIWTSPFHTNRNDAKWWLILGSTTGVLLATDKWTSRQLPNTPDQIAVARWTSRLGASYSLVPLAAGFYFVGTAAKNERFREVGILGTETLANTFLVVTAVKAATQRQRPLEGDGTGQFFKGAGRVWNEGASFPSGHATHSWALASVIAHQYPRPRAVPIVAYGVATTVIASRFAVRKHFASDVVAGAAIGWFIGDFVYGKRHNPALDPHHSGLRKILTHVHIGATM